MNADKVMAAIGRISDKHIEECAVVKPVRNCRKNRMILRLCVCTAILALVLGIGIQLQNIGKTYSAETIIAYAKNQEGAIVEMEIDDTARVPVSLFEAEDGLKGFLFSVESDESKEANKPASIAIITAGDYTDQACEMIRLDEMDLQPGRSYFFFVGSAITDFEDAVIFYPDEDGERISKITVRISETDGGYVAELQAVESYPRRNIDSED